MPSALLWPDRLLSAFDEGCAPWPRRRRDSALAGRIARRAALSAAERRTSAALMRVNHAGEIAAQAPAAASPCSRAPRQRALLGAAREERDPPRLVRGSDRRSSGAARACSLLCGISAASVSVCSPASAPTPRAGFVRETGSKSKLTCAIICSGCPAQDEKSAAILSQR